jgi:hypothetical protein
MNTECSCHEAESCVGERPRFFPRQLITAEDLTLGQDYVRHTLRRHNRLLHGWGVVCGAGVGLSWTCQGTVLERCKVVVQPGYILGPCGDEIAIECAVTVNLCPPADTDDACCPTPKPTGPIYLAIKYKDRKTRPVRVQPVGCGGDEQSCEYSRYCDGYEIGLLKTLPKSHENVCKDISVDPADRARLYFAEPDFHCPPCEDPWVVLASIVVDDAGNIISIDNCTCRRWVVTAAPFWRKCAPELQLQRPTAPVVVTATTTVPLQGVKYTPSLKVYAGDGISVDSIGSTATGTEVTLTVSTTAAAGVRLLVVVSEDGSTNTVPIRVP